MKKSQNFAITGVAGYIAPSHLKAIKETGNTLVAALDPHDSVGILDSYFPETKFFTEFERFDCHIEKLKREDKDKSIDYVTICSPNYLHDSHIRFGLRIGADIICEKPIVLNPWNIDALKELENETDKKIYTVLQLRLHPVLSSLKKKLTKIKTKKKHTVVLTNISSRGSWYPISWKGQIEKSGGLSTNIGIHFFDLLIWLFGHVQESDVHYSTPKQMCGLLELANANVQWFLSIDNNELPEEIKQKNQRTYRSLNIDSKKIEFSVGFTDLHTEVYKDIFVGKGFGLDDAKPSIALAHDIRVAKVTGINNDSHPLVKKFK